MVVFRFILSLGVPSKLDKFQVFNNCLRSAGVIALAPLIAKCPDLKVLTNHTHAHTRTHTQAHTHTNIPSPLCTSSQLLAAAATTAAAARWQEV